MSEQPEALRLADELEDAYPNVHTGLAPSSAAELRRLYALCEEMGDALDNAYEELKGLARAPDSAYAKPCDEFIQEIGIVLAKWKESK